MGRDGDVRAGGADAYALLCDECARRLGAARVYVVALPPQEVLQGLSLEGAYVVESLSHGSPITCGDLRTWGKRAREEGVALVADNSLAGCVGCPAVRLGAHLSIEPMESAEDAFTLVGLSRNARRVLPEADGFLGSLPVLPNVSCEVALRSLANRESRWRAASDVAQVVASYLACHPRVEQVRYPGLRSDPGFEVAARTLVGGFGPWVDYLPQDADGWVRWETAATDDARAVVLALERSLQQPK